MARTAPTAATLKLRYPAFASVDDVTIEYWIDDANGRDVDESWSEGDFAPAIMAAAAHRMIRAGVQVAGSEVSGFAASGITTFKSGSFNVAFAESAAARASGGGWGSTDYGLEYLELLGRNKSGMGVTAVGCRCA